MFKNFIAFLKEIFEFFKNVLMIPFGLVLTVAGTEKIIVDKVENTIKNKSQNKNDLETLKSAGKEFDNTKTNQLSL